MQKITTLKCEMDVSCNELDLNPGHIRWCLLSPVSAAFLPFHCRFHQENPLYINVIRDPVERQISHYYYHMFGSSGQPKAITEDHVEVCTSLLQCQ